MSAEACYTNISCVGQIYLSALTILIVSPILVYSIYQERMDYFLKGIYRPVKLVSQFGTLVMTISLAINFCNPLLLKYSSLALGKKLVVDCHTSFICVLYGLEAYYIAWTDDTRAFARNIFVDVVKYIGIAVWLMGIACWIVFVAANIEWQYAIWYAFTGVAYGIQQMFVVIQTCRMRRLLRGESRESSIPRTAVDELSHNRKIVSDSGLRLLTNSSAFGGEIEPSRRSTHSILSTDNCLDDNLLASQYPTTQNVVHVTFSKVTVQPHSSYIDSIDCRESSMDQNSPEQLRAQYNRISILLYLTTIVATAAIAMQFYASWQAYMTRDSDKGLLYRAQHPDGTSLTFTILQVFSVC